MKKSLLTLAIIYSAGIVCQAQSWVGVDTGTNGNVYALTTYNGNLVEGGSFTKSYGNAANYIAQWNGSTWSAIGTGMNNWTEALTVYYGNLYAGGLFTTAGGNSANYIAEWNGSSWIKLGSGMNLYVMALTVYNGTLIAGGYFSTAGGVTVNCIAQWNGAFWSALGTGMNNTVYALTVYNGNLIAGGEFTTAGGNPAKYIAQWNGSTWSAVGTGMDTMVNALTVYNGNLYAGGRFTHAGGIPASHIAEWNGTSWDSLGSGTNDFYVTALITYNSDLVVGGGFTKAGGIPASAIAEWNGTSWSAMSIGLNSPGTSLSIYNSHVYVGANYDDPNLGYANSQVAEWFPCALPSSPGSISGLSAVCTGSSHVYKITPVSGATSYTWTLPSGWSGTSSADSIVATPGTSGGKISVYATNACGNSPVRTMSVTVNSLPVVTASASPNTTVCAGTNVTLNGGGATTYSWSNGVTNGVAFIPASTNTYTVIGTDGNGCKNKDSITLTVNSLPTVTASASPNTTVCAGTNVTLNGGGATTYSWSGGVINGVAFLPASTNTYTVTGTDGNSCKNKDSITLTVNSLPGSAISLSANAVCAGTNDTLTETASGTGPFTYNWNTGGTNDTIIVSSGGAYSVTVTDANGCQSANSGSVTVNSLPTVTASASPNTTVCAGTNITLSGGGAATYTWSGGVTNGVAFLPASTNTYTVTGTDGNGCTNTKNITVTVNNLPSTSLTAKSMCSGSQDTLTETATGTGPFTYNWNTGGTNDTIIVSSGGTYSVTVTDANGCQATSNNSITVNPLPSSAILLSTNAVCAGTNDTLTETATGTGPFTYNWNTGGTNDTIIVSTGGTYSVTVTDANGCQATSNSSITVNPLPSSAILLSASAVCAGTNDTLKETATGNGPFTYNWNTGGTNDTIIVSTGGTYSVTVTDANGCQSVNSGSITVNPLPVITVTGMDTINQGTTDTLMASGANTYIWTSGSTKDSALVSPPSTTTYTVTGTDSNGCVSNKIFTVVVNFTTGIGTVQDNGKITLYPNPATEIIYVTTTMKDLDNATVKVFDVTGKELINAANKPTRGKKLWLGIADLAPGIYFMEIKTISESQTIRFVKE